MGKQPQDPEKPKGKEKPVSLAPLEFEEALRDLLAVQPADKAKPEEEEQP